MTRPTEASTPWSIYIVRCADGALYCGISPDVERRFALHVAGLGARYLRGRGPLSLAAEAVVGDRSTASRAEYAFKQLDKISKERLLAGAGGLHAFVLTCVDDQSDLTPAAAGTSLSSPGT